MATNKRVLSVELKAVVSGYEGPLKKAASATKGVEKGLRDVERAGKGLDPVQVRIRSVGGAMDHTSGRSGKFAGGLDRVSKGASGLESGMSGVADGISGVSTLMAEGAKAPADMAVAFANLGSAATTTAIPAVKNVGRGLAGLKGLAAGAGKALDGDLLGGLAKATKGAGGLGTGLTNLVAKLGGMRNILVGGGIAAGLTAIVVGVKALEDAAQARRWDDYITSLQRSEATLQSTAGEALLQAAAWGNLDGHLRKVANEGGLQAAEALVSLAEKAGLPAPAMATLKGELRHLRDELGGVDQKAQDVEESIQGMNDALRAQFDPVFAAADAQRNLNEALARQAEVNKDAASTAQDKAAADAEVMQAVVGLQAATNDLNTRVRQGTLDAEAASAQFVDMATRMGIPKAEARRLADQIFGATKRSLELDRQRPTPVLRVKDLASGQINAVRGLIRNFGGTVATATIRLQVIGLQEANRAAALRESFQHGGVVGGPRGKPRLVLAHGGETVVPTHSAAEMVRFGATPVAGASGGGGGMGGMNVTFNFTGSGGLAKVFQEDVRTGRIQLSVNGQRVRVG